MCGATVARMSKLGKLIIIPKHKVGLHPCSHIPLSCQVAAMRGELTSLHARLAARDEQLLKHVRVRGCFLSVKADSGKE